MLKIPATFAASLLGLCVGTAVQASYPSGSDKGQAVSAGVVQIALNPQPEPPNKNRRGQKPQKIKSMPQKPSKS